MSDTGALLADLARVKAIFQLRAICAVMNLPSPSAPQPATQDWFDGGDHSLLPVSPVDADIMAPTQLHASANVGEHEGHQLADMESRLLHRGADR